MAYFAPQPDSFAASRGHLITVMSMLFFAAGFPAVDVVLQSWGPITTITARIVLACALMVPIWFWIDGWDRIRDANWGRALWVGGIGFGAGTVLLILCQYYTDPVTVGLVTASMPVTAVILEILLDGRRLRLDFLIGVALVLVGGAVTLGGNLLEGSYGFGALLGILATVIFTWGSRETVHAFPALSTFGRATITFIGATVFCLFVYDISVLFDLGGTAYAPLSASHWGLLVFYAWGAMAISQALWIMGVERLGIGMSSFHLNAVPFYVMLILFLSTGEFDTSKLIGAAILCIGVVLAQRSDNRARRLMT